MKVLLCAAATFLFAACFAQREKDSAAIVRLLEKESATWRSGDVKGHAACWAIRPYSRILVSTGDSTVIDVPPQYVFNPPPGAMGKGGTSVNTAYKMAIYSDNAWVSHHEESTSKEGKKTHSAELRLLEKIKGEWKLVGQSIHIYKP